MIECQLSADNSKNVLTFTYHTVIVYTIKLSKLVQIQQYRQQHWFFNLYCMYEIITRTMIDLLFLVIDMVDDSTFS
jgi:hypothetical protein